MLADDGDGLGFVAQNLWCAIATVEFAGDHDDGVVGPGVLGFFHCRGEDDDFNFCRRVFDGAEHHGLTGFGDDFF